MFRKGACHTSIKINNVNVKYCGVVMALLPNYCLHC